MGLARLMGGNKKFVDKLQRVFDEGLYDPTNEPDIAYPYLFTYFKGEEWRTQKIVRELIDKYYSDQPDGIPDSLHDEEEHFFLHPFICKQFIIQSCFYNIHTNPSVRPN